MKDNGCMFNLKDKRIIITGASQGLGAVAAKAYAEQGARVALFGRSSDKLSKVLSGIADSKLHHSVVVDLFEPSQIGSPVDEAVTKLGGVDVVFHSAGGGLGLRDPLLSFSDLRKLFELNVFAAAEINRLVAPHLKTQGSGNLVHVGSIASYEAVGSVGYNTAKAALAAYVRSLGRELAADNIIVTGILPGGFISPGNAMDRLQRSNKEVYEKFISERLPRKRMAEAEELLGLILLLSSSHASMMGGCLVPVDAGEGKAYEG